MSAESRLFPLVPSCYLTLSPSAKDLQWSRSDQPHGRYEPVSSRVLVVDDDPGLLNALPELFRLRLPTIAVDTCESVTSALERLGRHDYGAVISDVRMPKHIGLNLLDHAESQAVFPCPAAHRWSGLRTGHAGLA